MKFKPGDKVVFIRDNTIATVMERGMDFPTFQEYINQGKLPVRFDGVDYGSPHNCHSSWGPEHFRYLSKLYKALK